MPRQYTVRPGAPLRLTAAVATIRPHGTPVVVSGLAKGLATISGGKDLDCKGAGGLKVSAVSTARIAVTYEEEVRRDKKGKLIGEAA